MAITPSEEDKVRQLSPYDLARIVMGAFGLTNKATFTTGTQALTTPGTAEQLPDVEIEDGYPVTLVASPGNSGNIYLGKSKTEAEGATTKFNGLAPGLAVTRRVQNLSAFWFDGDTAGDKISWIVDTDE